LELHGEFVVLRPLRVEDAELTLSWRLSDRASLLNSVPGSLAAQRQWIESRPENELNFIIELASRRPVGMLSLIAIDRVNRRAEAGRFLIGEPDAVKGQPVAIEAMKLLYELAFDRLGLQRIYGTVVEDNPLMVKWQRYFGMKEEGRLRRHYFIAGRFQDAICLALLEEDYRTVARPRMLTLIAAGRTEKAR
jgi:RimJ/RimL family protein N-acetyltransferase